MAVHLAWIIFILAGVALTAAGFFKQELFGFGAFRRVHLAGLLFTAAFAAFGEPCPLTTIEDGLRASAGRGAGEGPFIVRQLERLIYPEVHPAAIIVPTVLSGLFVALVYILRPPPSGKRQP